MENSPWEADTCSAGEEVGHILLNPKNSNSIDKSSTVDSVTRQLNAVIYLFEVHFNKILLIYTDASRVVTVIQGFQLKFCMYFVWPLCVCVLHVLPISTS
jgi:hypothetical protein